MMTTYIASGGIQPFELMHPFYKIGYGLPMAHGAMGARTIVLGSYNRLGMNIGVLFAWIGFWTLLALLYIVRERRRVHLHIRSQSGAAGAAGSQPSR